MQINGVINEIFVIQFLIFYECQKNLCNVYTISLEFDNDFPVGSYIPKCLILLQRRFL